MVEAIPKVRDENSLQSDIDDIVKNTFPINSKIQTERPYLKFAQNYTKPSKI